MKLPVYLDYNATTPVDPAVTEAMLPYFTTAFGNPSSSHSIGLEAFRAVNRARETVADFLNCYPDEIIFTSGGSESNNTAIKGIAATYGDKGDHIITSAIEHPAVIEVCKYLETKGFKITYLPVDRYGMISVDDLRNAITDKTILITVMHANNEIGTLQPIEKIARIAAEHSIPFHTDAAQSIGKVKVDVRQAGIDMLSLAGHKIYAPKGIGVLYVRRGIKLEKLIHGAGHENGRRAGTENVPYIVGLAKACSLIKEAGNSGYEHLKKLRDLLENKLSIIRHPHVINGHPVNRLSNTCSISFKNTDANIVLEHLTGVAASAGAACHADQVTVSSVLQAINLETAYARGTLRLSVGRFTTEEEIKFAADEIQRVIDNYPFTEKNG